MIDRNLVECWNAVNSGDDDGGDDEVSPATEDFPAVNEDASVDVPVDVRDDLCFAICRCCCAVRCISLELVDGNNNKKAISVYPLSFSK